MDDEGLLGRPSAKCIQHVRFYSDMLKLLVHAGVLAHNPQACMKLGDLSKIVLGFYPKFKTAYFYWQEAGRKVAKAEKALAKGELADLTKQAFMLPDWVLLKVNTSSALCAVAFTHA